MTKATLEQASTWLLQIRALQNIAESAKEARLLVRPIAASMIKTYAADAFCEASREAVSATLKFFKEADIRQRLDTWVHVNIQDDETLCVEAEAAPVDRAGKIWIHAFVNAGDDGKATRQLDLMRAHHDAAFRHMLKVDHRASSIAVYMAWDWRTAADWTDHWDDPTRIRANMEKLRTLRRTMPRSGLAAMAFGTGYEMLCRAVTRYAPQHRHLVDPSLLAIENVEPVRVAFVAPPVELDQGLFE